MYTDLRFEDKNNQKKTISVFTSGVIATATALDVLVFTLPENALVTNVYVNVLAAAATDSKLDVRVNATYNDDGTLLAAGTIIANDVDAASVAISAVVANSEFTTGGIVTVAQGNATALTDVGSFKLVVEYIELGLTNGQYTD